MRSNAHTRPPQHLNRAPKAGLAKSRGRHGSLPHCAHRRPNFTGDRSEARGHGAAHAALPPGSLRAGCACWCAPDGFAARKRRGGTQGAATPECARGRGPPPAWSSLMGLLRPHRAVAPAPRAPTDARGDHARPKSSPAVHAAWVCTKPRARVGRHTRGPTYPDIDIGASQTDSALMRGTARAAQPRRCGCVRLGCHMQKFQDPRVA